MRLIFLCSLPRSGSTLLQRLLAVHPKICTTSEPWILLPFCYTLMPNGIFSEYHHEFCYTAISDFINSMPNKEDDYYFELGKFARSLYEKFECGQSTYFLDKTPRYYLILHFIQRMFPDAKYIFLFRNPLQVMASVIETWYQGRLRLENNLIDFYKGPEKLAAAYNESKNNCIAINFDDLIKNPEENLRRIFDYLEIECLPNILNEFHSVKLSGNVGDKTGYFEYKHIESKSGDKWKATFNTNFRKKILMKYVRKLSVQTLKTFGYTQTELLQQIESIKTEKRGGISDRMSIMIGTFLRIFEAHLFKSKLRRRLEKPEPFYNHR